jgi:hypothetical protein
VRREPFQHCNRPAPDPIAAVLNDERPDDVSLRGHRRHDHVARRRQQRGEQRVGVRLERADQLGAMIPPGASEDVVRLRERPAGGLGTIVNVTGHRRDLARASEHDDTTAREPLPHAVREHDGHLTGVARPVELPGHLGQTIQIQRAPP